MLMALVVINALIETDVVTSTEEHPPDAGIV
jgi:hypothetical protein